MMTWRGKMSATRGSQIPTPTGSIPASVSLFTYRQAWASVADSS